MKGIIISWILQSLYQLFLFKNFIKSFEFFYSSRYNGTQPMYMNVIRDPLTRMTSWYYFIRFQPDHMRGMDNKTRHRVIISSNFLS